MWIVLSPLLVQKLCLRLPVEPAHIEGAVTVAHDVLWLEAPFAEVVANSLGIETRGILHCAWGDVAHRFVTDRWVKVLLHAPHQACAIDVNVHVVTARFDARKRYREDLG